MFITKCKHLLKIKSFIKNRVEFNHHKSSIFFNGNNSRLQKPVNYELIKRWTSTNGDPESSKTTQPSLYRSAILEEFGKPLIIDKVKNPAAAQLGSGMIRMGVRYCSLNMIDVKYMHGEDRDILLPAIPGIEFSGYILEVGQDSKENFKKNDKIVTLRAHKHVGGGLAEECIVDELDCFPLGGVSSQNAAVLLNSHATAYLAFTKYCPLKENDIVLIIAGPAGNGLAAIQVAKNVFNAKVYAICDTEDTSSLIRDQGAHKTISINEGLAKVYRFIETALKDRKAKCVYDAVGNGLMYVVADFVDPESGHYLSVDPFFNSVTFPKTKPEFKKSSKKSKEEKTSGDGTAPIIDSFVDKIQHVDLNQFRYQDVEFYRQTILDTLELCEEEVISPYISKIFGLYEINSAVEYINNKIGNGKILIDINKINEEELLAQQQQQTTAVSDKDTGKDSDSDTDDDDDDKDDDDKNDKKKSKKKKKV